jgi:sterol 3beta-glucosyltransferase
MTKVALVSIGTRGDIQPFVCLGHALAGRSHEVEMTASRNGKSMVIAAGLEYRALPVDIQAMLRTERAQQMLAAGRITAFLRWYYSELEAYADDLHRAMLEATESVDLIVCGVFAEAACRAIGKARGVPVVPIHLMPHTSSPTYPSTLLPQRSFGGLTRTRFAHELPLRMSWRLARRNLVTLHRELELPPPTWRFWMEGYRGYSPCLLGYSQTLFPTPGDWPARLHPVGFLQPAPSLREQLGGDGITAELEAWLAAGTPPVFFGFGSMPVIEPEAMLRTIRVTLADLGMRGILAAGWSKIETATDESLFVLNEVDHASLLPHCAAAVHHGGAGTTAASLAARIPILICSVFADQPFWGNRLRTLGAGETLPFTKLDHRRLTEGLHAILNPTVAARARELGRQMTSEDGVSAAVSYLERTHLGSGSPTDSSAHEKQYRYRDSNPGFRTENPAS